MYNAAIVGAGPAGIFTALELVKLKPDWKIILIEKAIKLKKSLSFKKRLQNMPKL